MGKNILITSFLILLMASIYVYLTREDNKSYRIIENDTSKHPRIILEDFTIYKYKDSRLKTTVSGQLCSFLEPNLLDIYGNIRGLRHDSEDKDYVVAQSAVVYFKAHGVIELMRGAELDKVELENNVRVGSDANTIKTEFARYHHSEKNLESDLPVEFKTPSANFMGESGFLYYIDNGNMVVNGPINGVLSSEYAKEKNPATQP